MNAFRGEAWMEEPCRSCPQRALDFAGCRCQAFHLTGRASATDPACPLSLDHYKVLGNPQLVVRRLEWWQKDRDLAGVRDEEELSKLPILLRHVSVLRAAADDDHAYPLSPVEQGAEQVVRAQNVRLEDPQRGVGSFAFGAAGQVKNHCRPGH